MSQSSPAVPQSTFPAEPAEPVMLGSGRGRSAMLDNARAIGIVLVVLGHAPGGNGVENLLIYAFHMPLFFLLSGMLVKEERLRLSSGRRCIQLFRTLIVPYLFFAAVSLAYWLLVKRHGTRAAEFENTSVLQVVRIILFPRQGEEILVDVPLWFLPCLFIVSLMHHVLHKRIRGAMSIAVACAVAGAVMAWSARMALPWPYYAATACVALGFFTIGQVMRRHVLDIPTHVAGRRAVAFLLLACSFAGLAFFNGRVNIAGLAFGESIVLYYVVALLGVASTLFLSSLLPRTALGSWLARNTMVIFPIHFLIFSLFTGIALVVFHAPATFKETTPFLHVGYAVGAIAACVPIAIGLRRWLPWTLAPRRAIVVAARSPAP